MTQAKQGSRTYRIHGLVDVRVDETVAKAVQNAIDFQIAHFRDEAHEAPRAPQTISVRPYDAFSPDVEVLHTFHLVRGLQECCYDDPEHRVAVRVEKDGFTIFADTGQFLINLFIQLVVLAQGVTLVHAAAYADPEGNVTLLPGAGGVGKTALLGAAVRDRGCKLLGDDIVGLGRDGTVYSFPRSFVLKDYHRSVYPEVFAEQARPRPKPPITWNDRVRRAGRVARDNMPFLGATRALFKALGIYDGAASLVGPRPPKPRDFFAVPVERIFGAGAVARRGPLARVVFLERYDGDAFRREPISPDSVRRRMVTIIHHEWSAYMRQFFALGALEIVDVPAYMAAVSDAMGAAVAGKPCELFLIPNGAAPDEVAERFFRDAPGVAG